MNIFDTSETPLSVTLLVFQDSSMMSLASALDPMRAANRLSKQLRFSWKILTPNNQPIRLTCGITISPDSEIDHQNINHRGDLLIIISGFHSDDYCGKSNLTLVRHLVKQHNATCAVESASWLIGRCGLLHNKKATTHWEDLENFEQAFPEAKVKPDRFTIDGSMITTAGASPTFDFLLELVQSRYGYPLAIDVSSVFIYQGQKHPDDVQQHLSLGILKIKEPRVANAIEEMEKHIDEPVSIRYIAGRVHLSPRQLENLFSQILGTTPSAYYRHLRLQAAAKLVINTNLDIREITLRTGFISLSAFSRAFKQYFSLSPIQLRKNGRLRQN